MYRDILHTRAVSELLYGIRINIMTKATPYKIPMPFFITTQIVQLTARLCNTITACIYKS